MKDVSARQRDSRGVFVASERVCSMDGCTKRHFGRGWCEMHYGRFRRNGDPARLVNRGLEEEPAAIWRLHAVPGTNPDDCWGWNGTTQTHGYGRIGNSGYAHRVAYEATVGPIPDGLHILHSCDNPPCTNPAHLSVGTHRDNMLDAAQRGRALWSRRPLRRLGYE